MTRKGVHAERTCENVVGLCGTTDFSLSLAVLDLLSIGLVVCNASGQMLFANRTAQEKIRKRDGLQLNPVGELCAKRACRRPGNARPRTVRITPSDEFSCGDAAFSVQRASGKRALTVLVRSIGTPQVQTAELPAALVLIFDSTVTVTTTEAELKQLYGLTATESRLANLLTDCKALNDCCRELLISRATACTHLRRIFKKTGVCRQSELVSLLLRSISLTRLGHAVSRAPSFLFRFAAVQRPLGKDMNAADARWTAVS
jgi:DNA-binding CsgD family transcriptional regulator